MSRQVRKNQMTCHHAADIVYERRVRSFDAAGEGVSMNLTRLQTALLFIIAFALGAIALRPYLQPAAVQAQTTGTANWFVEPGVQMLVLPEGGQVLGKVAIDMQTGRIWGFPTYTNASYPVAQTIGAKPQTSHPFALGRFAVEDTNK